ncbi:MAG: NAD(P)/FAD-dependent oxidoreductase [Chloroflexi bacterium]|nr:NAD(P)/FAD-dependent oxidoreductase [Chloroflexota bacterium]
MSDSKSQSTFINSYLRHTTIMAGNYQIIVTGAGAAGMMAAGRAAELGANVLLLEKMERPGKKILITGNGRCNLSNSRDMDSFITQFGANGRFLLNTFNRFFRDDLLALLRRYGIECKTEPDGKVYPTTDNAGDIVRAFERYMADGKVTVRFGVSVTGVLVENGRVSGVHTTAGNLPASAVIIAAGGSSHPQTGSTGDGFHIAAALGHTIVRLRPGLVSLVATDIEQAKQMQGASLRNVRITAFQCPAGKIDLSLVPEVDVGRGITGKRPKLPIIESRTGDAIITHFGLSGPIILEMSLAIVDALENGPVSVSIDLAPDRGNDMLRKELQQVFDKHSKRAYQNIVKDFLSQKLVEPFVGMTGVPPDKPGNQLKVKERESLLNLLKSLRFDIKGGYSMSTAMVTAGGISLKEINQYTMASQLVEGLYFCGEVMDLDAGTGGFNLQAAFSTGYVAGESAASFVLTKR